MPAAVAAHFGPQPGRVGRARFRLPRTVGREAGAGLTSTAAAGTGGAAIGAAGFLPQFVSQRAHPEVHGETGKQRPLERVGPAQLVPRLGPAQLPQTQPGHPGRRRQDERVPAQPARLQQEGPAVPRHGGYQWPRGNSAVTATTANSKVRYAIDRWNSRIGAGEAWPAALAMLARSRCASIRNQPPRPAAHAPYTQPAYGASSSVAATIAYEYSRILRATVAAGATTGSLGTPAAA